jgi:hypothetical protein
VLATGFVAVATVSFSVVLTFLLVRLAAGGGMSSDDFLRGLFCLFAVAAALDSLPSYTTLIAPLATSTDAKGFIKQTAACFAMKSLRSATSIALLLVELQVDVLMMRQQEVQTCLASQCCVWIHHRKHFITGQQFVKGHE